MASITGAQLDLPLPDGCQERGGAGPSAVQATGERRQTGLRRIGAKTVHSGRRGGCRASRYPSGLLSPRAARSTCTSTSRPTNSPRSCGTTPRRK